MKYKQTEREVYNGCVHIGLELLSFAWRSSYVFRAMAINVTTWHKTWRHGMLSNCGWRYGRRAELVVPALLHLLRYCRCSVGCVELAWRGPSGTEMEGDAA